MTFEGIKEGDYVFLYEGSGLKVMVEVTKVTKGKIYTMFGLFRRKDGKVVGGANSYITPATPNEIEEKTKELSIRAVIKKMRQVEQLSFEDAEKINNILWKK